MIFTSNGIEKTDYIEESCNYQNFSHTFPHSSNINYHPCNENSFYPRYSENLPFHVYDDEKYYDYNTIEGNQLFYKNSRYLKQCTKKEKANNINDEYNKRLRKKRENKISLLLENEIYLKNVNWYNNIIYKNLDPLSQNIFTFHRSVMQWQSHLNKKLYLRDMIYYSLQSLFISANLYIVGSSLNGFGTNFSDMDLCLMLSDKELNRKNDAIAILNVVKIRLSVQEWIETLQLIVAKVPILRITFKSPFSNITVDLNANNSVTILNTHLICAYSNFDWRVRPLVLTIKEWAKKCGINNSNNSTFTSYSLVLMCIHYLQYGLKNPILPSIQEAFKNRFKVECNVTNLNKEIYIEELKKDFRKYQSTVSLGELLIGFLEYYSEIFDFSTDAISIRHGKKVKKSDIFNNYNSQSNFQWSYVCIEEPFTFKNTAYSIYNPDIFEAIKKCFSESYHFLKVTRDFDAFLNVRPINYKNGRFIRPNV